ncbi:glycosyltransferase family A protein [Lichenibacterium ramalinae]|uniref:Glycosyltransferase family 2 protein n=1 Tax=Lichenibacterium ramalinae TaxID=2316527 RepID=A0A4Q2R6J8_9HYPH|nr:glycosyltransferase family A protein [Lichenibacterium ramalinae]RYB02187.1 glycosyltransferase family 2 protein [Lichenibacterium ramalinae]
MNEALLRRTVPVVVNSYNQPTYLLRMVARLIAADFRDIWIVDQASTTPETHQALALLESSSRCRIYRLRENAGPHWFFRSDLFRLVGSVFVYTDADLDFPHPFPPDFLSRLLVLTQRYKVGKAGCALDLSDADLFVERISNFQGRDYTIAQWEERFWAQAVEPDVYPAILDTTFALYNKAHFQVGDSFARAPFLQAVRVGGAWTAKHLPWYRDKRVPADEWAAYEASTKHSHWFNSAREAQPAPAQTEAL